jgi:hypothetical protein
MTLTSSFFPNKALAEWAYLFVVWDGYIYVVSYEYVTEVEKEIGKVTLYSTHEGTYAGHFSNAYPEGTIYYSIKGVSTEDSIAVQDSEGKYKRANRDGKYDGELEEQENGSTQNVHSTAIEGSEAREFKFNYYVLLFVFLVAVIIGISLAKRKRKHVD